MNKKRQKKKKAPAQSSSDDDKALAEIFRTDLSARALTPSNILFDPQYSLIFFDGSKGSCKMGPELKRLLIQLSAFWYTATQIRKYIEDQFNIKDLTMSSIHEFCRRHKKEIQEVREKLITDMLAIPIANTFKRMEVLQTLVDDIFRLRPIRFSAVDEKGNFHQVTEMRDRLWMEEPNAYGTKLRGNHDVLNKLLNAARDEMKQIAPSLRDPEKPGGDLYLVNIQQEIRALSDEELEKRIDDRMRAFREQGGRK